MYGVASLIVTATVLPCVGLVAVCLRFLVRFRLKRSFVGIDDWLIAFACVLVWVQAALQIAGKTRGISPRFLERKHPAKPVLTAPVSVISGHYR